MPFGFVRGEIDLAATGDLGKGYEQGAIISKVYAAGEPSMETLSGDFQILLDLYDVLYKRLGPSIVDNIPPPEEQEFQKAASALSANKAGKEKYQEPPPGPVPPPPPIEHTAGSGYVRNPAVAGAAISKSGYRCEWDPTHLSFVSRITQENFVEAHHLIPMQFQGEFAASLDVVENIIVLCPICHRLLHHGRRKDKEGRLAAHYKNRVELLKGRGLVLPFSRLCSLYRGELEVE